MLSRSPWWLCCGTLVLVLGAATATHAVGPHQVQPLYSQGVAVGAGQPLRSVPQGMDAAFVPGTSLLRRGGEQFAATEPRAVARSRAWLRSGRVPGAGGPYTGMTRRALLDLRLLTLANGAAVAGWDPSWRYVWPRDAAFVTAAFSATGHYGEARDVLGFLSSVRPGDGRWRARYLPDGSGRAPGDRGVQLDGSGWVTWAVWFWYTTLPEQRRSPAALNALWPMVRSSADEIAQSLDRRGLPPPSPDYWERPQGKTTLGTAAPLLAGLRAAADLATRSGHEGAARRWSAAAHELANGIAATFEVQGFPRTLPHGGADAAVTFCAPPFAPAQPSVRAAVARSAGQLTIANGGIKPGARWHRDDVAWTPETALFALAAAGLGEHERSRHWLSWLDAHRTELGSLSEKVGPDGQPIAVAPLAWTAATVLLAVTELHRDLPVPPVAVNVGTAT